MSAVNIFNNEYGVPRPEDPDDIEQLYTFKDTFEDRVQDRSERDLLDEKRINSKRLADEKKSRKKLFKVAKLIRQKEADSSILSKLDRLSNDMVYLKEGMVGLKGNMVGLKDDMVGLKGEMVGLKGDMTDVSATLKRLCFNDGINQNIRRRQMGLPLQKVPFIVGDGPNSQVPSIQSLEMIDALDISDCQYLLAGYGEDSVNMSMIQMKATLRDILGFIELKDMRFQFNDN